MKNLHKSTTVKIGTSLSTLIAVLFGIQDQVIEVLVGFGMGEDKAKLTLKAMGIVLAVLTAFGVAYGRSQTETKPPLDKR